ncbi:uncharacterized protein ELE39_003379 [Cryptosporidium sp. chipmunk genotype I]|uniref:uncharacterized protein n=1 Tax=Cryptosporidium sp. chipmunk genotype I TaxID=1280935 RepID=UPI003519E542|nr:hypothetical protein ELE39_003379 [Cryptosporidium sp. chipmunk genotype I]
MDTASSPRLLELDRLLKFCGTPYLNLLFPLLTPFLILSRSKYPGSGIIFQVPTKIAKSNTSCKEYKIKLLNIRVIIIAEKIQLLQICSSK